jgi:predicted ATP-binding protein involved in virulence
VKFELGSLKGSCKACNAHKGNKIPLKKNGKRLIINPFMDNPDNSIGFLENGKLYPKGQEGLNTIDILGLNRQELVMNRIFELKKYPNEGRIYFFDKENKRQQFSGFLNSVLSNREKQGKAILKPYISVYSTLEEQFENYYNKSTYVKNIEIDSFKNIENIRITIPDFNMNDSTVPCLMLLGENGSGKTSILQAIALSLFNSLTNSIETILPDRTIVITKGKYNTKVITTYASNIGKSELYIDYGMINLTNEVKILPVLYYSATRIQKEINEYTHESKLSREVCRLNSLFNSFDVLNNASAWLNALDFQEFKVVNQILSKVLQFNDIEKIIQEPENVFFKFDRYTDSKVAIEQMSEGRKNILSLICDILMHISSLQPDKNLEEQDILDYSGVILIDEIGAHLHPTWKMKIVSQLRKTFPKLQFICTTHDPLCLKGFKQGEIVVLRKDKDGKVFMVNQEDLPNPEAMRADQLLTSQYFGLNSTIDLDIEKKFAEYYDLLARGSNLTKEESEKLKELTDFVKDQKVLGDSTREQLYFQVIDSVIAKFRKEGSKEKISIKKEVIDRVNEELKKIGL